MPSWQSSSRCSTASPERMCPTRPLADPVGALSKLLQQPPLPQLAEMASVHPRPLFLVGGALRDALLERPIEDVDLVVAGAFREFLEALAQRLDRAPSPLGDRFQDTHRFRWFGCQVDVSRLRPVAGVAEHGAAGGDVFDLDRLGFDLERRDLTINAMALRLGPPITALHQLLDPLGGCEDLRRCVIRCSSQAALVDDPLRTLRAVRYATVLPGFELEERTAVEIAARAALLRSVAPERVQSEWIAMLQSDAWADGVVSAFEFGLGEVTLGPMQAVDVLTAWAIAEAGAVSVDAVAVLELRLAALCWALAGTGDLESVHRRLTSACWPGRLLSAAARIAVWARDLGEADNDGLAGWAMADARAAAGACALAAAAATHQRQPLPPQVHCLQQYAERAAEPRWITGADLLSWGMAEGQDVGAALEEADRGQIRRRWSSVDEAHSWARALVARRVMTRPPAAARRRRGGDDEGT